ncbi:MULTISPECIES: S-layer homology domain-containing protein [unclassified Sedimentibacter]|uniref:S-layer homology domain-containing protein n=1 Tax=unclassified Sedimentibacter TaxID=2649220 RepID=UPI0027E1B3AB|nr:S-layer homology domain-containing protein [Sedimentibacter sp. MB35-C1]WMJ77637.1 S-layer homology domain-containing protein [Sedimentibacter sp. MB35-C1]
MSRNKMIQKATAIVLSVIMAVGMIPVSAAAKPILTSTVLAAAEDGEASDLDENDLEPANTVSGTAISTPIPALEGMFTLLSTGSAETQVLGLGTEEYPLRIETAAQLADFARCLNSGLLPDTLPEQYHLLLVNDIDLSEYGKNYDGTNGWMPIGLDSKPFMGTFDGGGKVITGLYINRDNTDHAGLFGSINAGTVQNLILPDVNASGSHFIGGIAGDVVNGGTVQNCSVSGSVSSSGGKSIGGVIGAVEGGTVQNCVFNGSISGSGIFIGGIAGAVVEGGTMQNCIVTADVSGSGTAVGCVSGAVINSSTVQDCAALNLSIITTSSNNGRIVGAYHESILSGNYAWSGMMVNDHTVSSNDADSINGADADVTAIQSLWTDGPLNTWDSSLWTLAHGKLPVLSDLPNQSDALPVYITGLAGFGSSSDPYLINSAADLKWLADAVNSGETFSGEFFRLENDIDISAYGESYEDGRGWTPIGKGGNDFMGTFEGSAFMGTFDGNGKTIVGLYINRDDTDYVGLFGMIYRGIVQNLFLQDVNIIGENHVGGITGNIMYEAVKNCTVSGSINGSNRTGGIAGSSYYNTVQNCAVTCSINGKFGSIGGITGNAFSSTIQNCINTGRIGAFQYVGSIVGIARNSTIKHCAALNPSINSKDSLVGRVAGYAGSSTLLDNYAWSSMTVNDGTVSGSASGTNGADANATAIQTLWISGGLNTWDSSVWTLAEGKMPVLTSLPGQIDSLPAYITGLAGLGSNSSPYLIYSADDLKWLANMVNSGEKFSGKYFRLENDIDLSAYGKDYNGGKGWMPIGNDSYNDYVFGGHFDGNGHIINGLYINNERNDASGLFGNVVNGSIKGLEMINVNITGGDYVGGIAGYINGTLQNCRTAGSISGVYCVGGIAGACEGLVQNCVSNSSITGSYSIGGIIGTGLSSIQNCINTGNVKGDSDAGGIAGYVYTISDIESSKIENCINTGSVTCSGENVGGITGTINNFTIQNCMVTGSVIGYKYVGGIVGGTYTVGHIQNCAALSTSISATGSYLGRISGSMVNLTNNYSFINMKVNGSRISDGTPDNNDGEGASTALLFTTSFWRDALGFDETAWNISNGRLPYLSAFPEYAPTLYLEAYTFPAADSSDITLDAQPTLLLKSSSSHSVDLTASGSFKDTAWPNLVWEASDGILNTAADTYSSKLTVPAGFAGTITVTAKPSMFPSLPGKKAVIQVNGDLEGTVNVSGVFRYGQTLIAMPSITSPDTGKLSYQWMMDSAPIIGANNVDYELTAEDIGKIVSVVVTAQNYTDKIQSAGQTVLRSENSAIPSAPQLESKTETSIALKSIAGYEYAILSAGSDTALLGLSDAFQNSPLFTELAEGTSYDLYQRIAGTEIIEPSAFSEKLTITTDIPLVTSKTIKTPPVKIMPEKSPGQPVTAAVPITAIYGQNGTAIASITDGAILHAIAKAQSNAKMQSKIANGIAVELDITTQNSATSLTAKLTRSSLNSLVSAAVKNFTVNSQLVSVGFDQKALQEIQIQTSGDITISITPARNLSSHAHTMINARPAYDITISYIKNGSPITISSLNGGIATIAIPYIPESNEAAGYLYGVYVDDNSNAIRIYDSAYDSDTKAMLIFSGHLSIYGIGYTAPSAKFTDISTHWGKESIDYVAGRGLLSGTSETTFDPKSTMTRGMLVTSLGRLAGVDPKAFNTNSFSDVKADGPFRPYIEWAYSEGIVQGIGNQQFAPDRAITREEISAIFANYARATDYQLPVIREAASYMDTASIDSMYRTAVTAMRQAGIMTGSSGNNFNPKSGATRAEVSTMLHRYIKLTVNPATANSWSLNDAGQWFCYKDGKALTGTKTIDKTRYFFRADGTLKTGWVKYSDNWLYFSGNKMLTGWQNIKSDNLKKTYYFDTYGNMVSGKWMHIDDKWYYFYDDGSLAKSTKVGSYEVDENGARK